MDIGNIISSVLSLIAISFTIIVYLKHDKRLKKQEEKLNEYQLRRFEEEVFENKKAQVRGGVVKGEKGRRDLKIYNMGKASARDICIEFLDSTESKILFLNNPSPYELLNIDDHFEIKMQLYSDSSDILKIKIRWTDDFKEQNEYVQHFHIR